MTTVGIRLTTKLKSAHHHVPSFSFTTMKSRPAVSKIVNPPFRRRKTNLFYFRLKSSPLSRLPSPPRDHHKATSPPFIVSIPIFCFFDFIFDVVCVLRNQYYSSYLISLDKYLCCVKERMCESLLCRI